MKSKSKIHVLYEHPMARPFHGSGHKTVGIRTQREKNRRKRGKR